MSDGISFKPTDGDKRAEVFRRLADAESDASRAARQLDTYERMVINQRDAVAQADELCNTLRKECAALLSHLDGADAPTEPQAPAQPLDDLRSVTPASEQDASEVINNLVDELVGDVTFSPDTVAMQTYMDGDQVVIREISAEEMYAPPPTDLWQQGYNDKLNGYEPSLAEPEYAKGYEARALIEREHSETMERAKFFAEGMMADADRHAQERSMMEKAGEALAAIFKREREDA